MSAAECEFAHGVTDLANIEEASAAVGTRIAATSKRVVRGQIASAVSQTGQQVCSESD